MDTPIQDVDVRLAAALADEPSRIPVLLGPCGSGRTRALCRLRDRLPAHAAQYVDVERVVSTPERFLERLTAGTPFVWQPPPGAPDGPREAYARALSYFARARTAGGGPATFLLDEAFDVRVFESFPGLAGVLGDTLAALASSPNRAVLATKFEARALRALRGASDRFLVLHAPAVAVSAIAASLMATPGARPDWAQDAARAIVALADGRAAYAAAMVRVVSAEPAGACDPVEAFARLLGPGGDLASRCRFSFECRLHRARGYGALRAVLEILADDEPLNLTEISLRLGRSPGSTKDYLGWLEDVDLVRVQGKRYRVADPVLRLWIGLNTGPDAPAEADAADAVRRYALARLSAGVTPGA